MAELKNRRSRAIDAMPCTLLCLHVPACSGTHALAPPASHKAGGLLPHQSCILSIFQGSHVLRIPALSLPACAST